MPSKVSLVVTRRSENTLIDSDEVLEEYLVSRRDKSAPSSKQAQAKAVKSASPTQVDPPTTRKKTLRRTEKMSSARVKGFLPIAKPRPDPPDEMDAVSEGASQFQAPALIEVRSSVSNHADDLVTEVSDVTYTTEFVSDDLAFGQKRPTGSSPIRRYQAMLQEKKNRRESMRSGRLLSVAEERDTPCSSVKLNKIDHIDMTRLGPKGASVNPIDVTDLSDVREPVAITKAEKKKLPVILDASSYEESEYKPSSEVSVAKRDHALVEAKAKLLIKKTKKDPIEGVDASENIVGPPTPRLKSREEKSSQNAPTNEVALSGAGDIVDPPTSGATTAEAHVAAEKVTPESPVASKPEAASQDASLSATEGQVASAQAPQDPLATNPSPKAPPTPSLRQLSTRAMNPGRGIRAAGRGKLEGNKDVSGEETQQTPSCLPTCEDKKNATGGLDDALSLSSDEWREATLVIKETVSKEGSVIIDTTNIDEDDIAAMQLLNSADGEGGQKKVFSFVSSSEVVPSDSKADAGAASKSKAQDEDNQLKEFMMFTVENIKSLASTVNQKVTETLKDIPPIVTDRDMDGMLGALDKGMSERNFIVSDEDEREMLSNFIGEHVAQPVCGVDEPPNCADGGAASIQVDEIIDSVKATYKKGFGGCGIQMPKSRRKKKRSQLLSKATPKEFVIPVNYGSRRSSIQETRE